MTKADPLTSIEHYAPPWYLGEVLQRARGRVLDFGCGRGELVLWCRQRGIDAVGFEPNESYVRNGNVAAVAMGLPHVLRTSMDAFADSSFDLVVSNQVLEHVSDLADCVARITAVTAPGGRGLHIYPAKWRPIEGHLNMPLIHWMPESMRRHAIRAMLSMGLGPRNWDASADELWRYTVEHTYYRSLREVIEVFRSHGLAAEPARRGVRFEAVRRRLVTVYLETRLLERAST